MFFTGNMYESTNTALVCWFGQRKTVFDKTFQNQICAESVSFQRLKII